MNDNTDGTPTKQRLDRILAGDEKIIKDAAVPRAQQSILSELRKSAPDAPDIDAIGTNAAILEGRGSQAFNGLMGAMRAGKNRAPEAVAVITEALARAHEKETNVAQASARSDEFWRNV